MMATRAAADCAVVDSSQFGSRVARAIVHTAL